MGKALVEKLLRSCPDVGEIFLLMRPKHGVSIDDRLKKTISLPVFDRLRAERPSALDKLIPVSGDVSAEGLGLAALERQFLIERVSVIFHVAANVRFDDNLKHAIFVNTRSTRDVCILAGSMKKLVSLVHVSSTYSQANKPEVHETVYQPEADWRKTIKVAETVDDHLLETMTAKYLGSLPNTYTFTKGLAEQVITDYSKELPAVIFRPSIVISSVEEPAPGWLDNFNGPVGLMVGGGKGVLRVVNIDPKVCSDFMPVDVAIKTMLIASWKRGTVTITSDPSLHVYNCAANGMKSITAKDLIDLGFVVNRRIPLEGMIWHPSTIQTPSRLLYYIYTVILHLLPAFAIDGVLKLTNHKPMLVKLQRKVYVTNATLGYFLTNQWVFHNDKFMQLLNDMLPEDEKDFSFYYDNFNIHKYFETCLIGAKKYLLHEDMANVPAAKQHYNRMWWIDRVFKAWLCIAAIWIFLRLEPFAYVSGMLHSTVSGSIFEEMA